MAIPQTPNQKPNQKRNQRVARMRNSERGQGLVEYALGLVLVGMTASVALVSVGPSINDALCQVIENLNEELAGDCVGSETTSGVTVMFAKYNASKGELDIQAKAPEDCPYDLEVVGMGTMERAGSSYVFKYEQDTEDPPTEVTVGHSECGYTTVPVTGH